jgi:S-formylglutathione hydrolase FrmB
MRGETRTQIETAHSAPVPRHRRAESAPLRVAVAALLMLVAGCSSSHPVASARRDDPGPTTALSVPAAPSNCAGTGSLLGAELPFEDTGTGTGFVYLPACYDAQPTRSFPVLYLLHGASADPSQWPDVGVVAAADSAIGSGTIGPMIIVMPDGGPGIADDFVDGLIDRLVPWTDRSYRTVAARAGRAVGGISRGGRIAVLAAAEHPDVFAAAGGHSPVLTPGDATNTVIAGLAQLGSGIALDVGAGDPLRSNVSAFAALALPGVTVSISPGGHDRGYWGAHVLDYLAFYGSHLRDPADQPDG